MGKFAKFCSERIHRNTDPRLVCKLHEIWPTGNRKVVHYLPHKKQISPRSLALDSARIAPKIRQGQRQTMFSECRKFNPNQFTSGEVIAECVNTVKTHHKVNPVLG